MGSRKVKSQAAEELASHGYVVVAMDHTDCWATEFPDGRYLTGNHSGDVAGRLTDMQFLLDEVTRLNNGDPMFAGRLDLNCIGRASLPRLLPGFGVLSKTVEAVSDPMTWASSC